MGSAGAHQGVCLNTGATTHANLHTHHVWWHTHIHTHARKHAYTHIYTHTACTPMPLQPYFPSELASLEQPLLQLLQAFNPRGVASRGGPGAASGGLAADPVAAAMQVSTVTYSTAWHKQPSRWALHGTSSQAGEHCVILVRAATYSAPCRCALHIWSAMQVSTAGHMQSAMQARAA
eukprot:1153322-Pelagomonas_calceolata.AAC.1